MNTPLPATPAHQFIQRMTCQSLKKNGADIIQCQSCIERRNDSGGCRFAGFRAFKLLSPDKSQQAAKTNPASSPSSKLQANSSKRKGTSDPGINGTSKRRKLNANPRLPPGLDYQNYALVGDRYQHLPTKKDKGCLFSTNLALGTIQQELSQSNTYIMTKIAPTLKKGITRELEHEKQSKHPDIQHPIIRIAEDPAQRSLCDACATTLFIISYVCHLCGREYCPDCYDDWADNGENPRFETCSRNKTHKKAQLIIAVRACEGEVDSMVNELNNFVQEMERSKEKPDEDCSTYATRRLQDAIFAPVFEFPAGEFDEDSFKRIWGLHGRPIIITNCLERFKLPWDPKYFINNHGNENCTLVQTCPPFNNYTSKVSKFFEQFGQTHTIEALKLKDWPPADNFADVFPELMLDFELALPDAISNFVKHDGVYNLTSRFPEGYNKPDLGPKMYNAFPATVQMDGTIGGTTNLHRDITDAINFMMFATSASDTDGVKHSFENDKDRSPGAIWDIFPIGATKHIRKYLDEKYPNQPTDPFHRQNCYLAQEDLKILYRNYGVQSYRILQRPGDAIMIPAGCAHQVRNIKDCIKVAVDFLSPESVEICEYLLQENRAIVERANSSPLTKKGKESKKMSRIKKEDVLQLWKCLMYYYEGVRGQLWSSRSSDKNSAHKSDFLIKSGANTPQQKKKQHPDNP
ncbi:hypothetical protein TWF694_011867 [Orbilia ellipsospora]|uniref:JmjC domain-containing protein n=1 Tax=Orbilia ellipsospora TaxID=2528407 RepID=A0AAV9X7W3_9PEZI